MVLGLGLRSLARSHLWTHRLSHLFHHWHFLFSILHGGYVFGENLMNLVEISLEMD